MKTYTPVRGMIECIKDTGDYVAKLDYDAAEKRIADALKLTDVAYNRAMDFGQFSFAGDFDAIKQALSATAPNSQGTSQTSEARRPRQGAVIKTDFVNRTQTYERR